MGILKTSERFQSWIPDNYIMFAMYLKLRVIRWRFWMLVTPYSHHVRSLTKFDISLVIWSITSITGQSRCIYHNTWWRHQMETFSALLAICAGNSPVPGEFPAQRPVTRSFGVFVDVRLIKRLSKHSRGWWFETLSYQLWRHRNDFLQSN